MSDDIIGEEIVDGDLIVCGYENVTGFDILKKGGTVGAFDRVYETCDGGFILGMWGYSMLIAADSSLKVISGSGHKLHRDKDTGVITATVGATSYVTHPPSDIKDLLKMTHATPMNFDLYADEHMLEKYVFLERDGGIYVKTDFLRPVFEDHSIQCY